MSKKAANKKTANKKTADKKAVSAKGAKPRGTLGTLFTIGGSVTLAPVLLRRFKEGRANGDKLAIADAAVSAAALTVGVLQVLRARKPSGHANRGTTPAPPKGGS